MLESRSLIFGPWALDGATWARRVCDAETQAPLGVVRCAARPRSWLTWLQASRIEVLETEDEALLLALVRSWGIMRLWDLYDADDNRIGSYYPPVLLDREGVRCGYIQTTSAHRGEVLDQSGACLADFDLEADQALHLRHHAPLGPNPYVRMLVVGSVLAQHPPPP